MRRLSVQLRSAIAPKRHQVTFREEARISSSSESATPLDLFPPDRPNPYSSANHNLNNRGISSNRPPPSKLMHIRRDIVLKFVDPPHVGRALLGVNNGKTGSTQTKALTIASIFRLSSSSKCVLITCPSSAQEFPYFIIASS